MFVQIQSLFSHLTCHHVLQGASELYFPCLLRLGKLLFSNQISQLIKEALQLLKIGLLHRSLKQHVLFFCFVYILTRVHIFLIMSYRQKLPYKPKAILSRIMIMHKFNNYHVSFLFVRDTLCSLTTTIGNNSDLTRQTGRTQCASSQSDLAP